MTNRRTPVEARWPLTPEFSAIADSWSPDFSANLLRLVWEAYDLLAVELLSMVDCSQNDDSLETSITQELEKRIRRLMSGDELFDVQHKPCEYETRLPAPAQAPEYDIAFALRAFPRTMWPLEAKVLRTDKALAEYVKEIRANFQKCRYAPFSNQGAMLGYLVSGSELKALDNIQKKLRRTLSQHSDFPNRPHKTSEHRRIVPSGKPYPKHFRCHHLILRLA